MIKQKSIDSVMAAVRIEEVVGDFISLRKQGQDFVGICPFHDDKNPSLHVSPRLGIYKCFVCDAAGNPVPDGDIDDNDRMYGQVGNDLVLVQYFIFDKVLKGLSYYEAGNPIQYQIERFQVE